MSVVRRFWVLAVGTILLVGGTVWIATAPVVASFGWTAYAPLTSVTYTPSSGLIIRDIVVVVGAILVAGWVGYQIGRQRKQSASEQSTSEQK